MSSSFNSIRVLSTNDRIAHSPPDSDKDEHCHHSRNDQDSHGRPDRSRRSGDRRHKDRPGDCTELVQCLVYAEAAAESYRSGSLR
jgi:hypothetical protein